VRLRQVNDAQTLHRQATPLYWRASAYGGAAVHVALNGNSTMPYPFVMDLRIARETGHDGVLIVGDKLRRYLAEGFSVDQAKAALDGLPVFGMNNIRDIERCSASDRAALLADTEDMCRLAQAIGCPSIQLLTGPLDPTGGYRDPLLLEPARLARETAANLKEMGATGRHYGVSFYVEPLAWTPLGKLERMLQVLDDAGQDNVGLAIDFWHLWNTGVTPDQVSRIDGKLIRSVDVCDAIGSPGELAGADQRGRRVWTGCGAIPLKEWVDAVRATGFDGTWSCELLSPQHWQLDPWRTAYDLRQLMHYLFL
jgi:sugar phosphate isomerase/epimerase